MVNNLHEGIPNRFVSYKEQYSLTKAEKAQRDIEDRIKQKYLHTLELRALLKATEISIRDNAIFLISYYHGLRISEVGIIQMEHYKDGRLYVTRIKGGISNWYAVNEEVKKALKRWLVLRGATSGPLFASRKTDLNMSREGHILNVQRGISKRQLDYLFKQYAKEGKLPRKHWNFHTLRHTCAVNMVDKDIPMKQIQDWLGHSSIQSTLIYANISTAKRDETARKFFGVKTLEGGPSIDWGRDLTRKRKKPTYAEEFDEIEGLK